MTRSICIFACSTGVTASRARLERSSGRTKGPGTIHGANPAKGAFDDFAADCDRKPEALRAACLALGGREIPVGELSFEIPLFDFLPVMVQFWSSDEEFPPVFKLMWDENVLMFLRFETVCYAARFLVMRLQAHMGLWVENTEGHM